MSIFSGCRLNRVQIVLYTLLTLKSVTLVCYIYIVLQGQKKKKSSLQLALRLSHCQNTIGANGVARPKILFPPLFLVAPP